MTAVRERIHLYTQKITGLPPTEAAGLCFGYLERYGTALGGLQRDYQVDAEAFLAFVHDIAVGEFLPPNQELEAMLSRLPQEKLIFTNSPAEHAQRVVEALGIAHHFKAILDVRVCEFVPKPAASPYDCLMAHLPHAPQETLFVDDRAVNLGPAAERGITTVLLTENGHCPAAAHYCIHHILELENLGRVDTGEE